eukprot:m.241704 g.241704  ORF g.241704 m.241704 type:complete len:729 (+) comp24687_c0_seq1:85-2271(+)
MEELAQLAEESVSPFPSDGLGTAAGVDLVEPGGEHENLDFQESDADADPPALEVHEQEGEFIAEEGEVVEEEPQDGRTVLEVLLAMAANNPDQPEEGQVDEDEPATPPSQRPSLTKVLEPDSRLAQSDSPRESEGESEKEGEEEDEDEQQQSGTAMHPAATSHVNSQRTGSTLQSLTQGQPVLREEQDVASSAIPSTAATTTSLDESGPASRARDDDQTADNSDVNVLSSHKGALDPPAAFAQPERDQEASAHSHNHAHSHTAAQAVPVHSSGALSHGLVHSHNHGHGSDHNQPLATHHHHQQQQPHHQHQQHTHDHQHSANTHANPHPYEDPTHLVSAGVLLPPPPQFARTASTNSSLFEHRASPDDPSPDSNSLSHTLASLTAAADTALRANLHQQQQQREEEEERQQQQQQQGEHDRKHSPVPDTHHQLHASPAPMTTHVLAHGAAHAASLIPAAGMPLPPTRSPAHSPGHSPAPSPGTARAPVRIRVAEADATNRTEPLPWASVYNAAATAETISAQVRDMAPRDLMQAAAQLSAGSVRRRVWVQGEEGEVDAETKKGHRRSQSLHDFLAAANAAQGTRKYSPNTQRATQFATLRFSSTDSRRRDTLFTAGRAASHTGTPDGRRDRDDSDDLDSSVSSSSRPTSSGSSTIPAAPATAEPPRRRSSFLNLFRKSRDRLSVPEVRYGVSAPATPSGKTEKRDKDKEKHVCSAINEGLSRCECGRTW